MTYEYYKVLDELDEILTETNRTEDVKIMRRTMYRAKHRWARISQRVKCFFGYHEGGAIRSRFDRNVITFFCDHCDHFEEISG